MIDGVMEEKIEWVKYTCGKCGKTWVPRTEKKPSQCPGCQQRQWDTRNDDGSGGKLSGDGVELAV